MHFFLRNMLFKINLALNFSVLVFLPQVCTTQNRKVSNQRFVSSTNGLNVRSEPNSRSGIVTVAPFCSEVLLTEKQVNQVEIQGLQGYWSKIVYKENVGWVFDGYLKTNLEENDSLLCNIATIEYAKQFGDPDKNYIFEARTLKFIEDFSGYKIVTFDITTPKGQGTITTYEIWIRDNDRWRVIFSRITWGFVKLILRDVNGDSIPDLIGWWGGCCGNSAYVAIQLGTKFGEFSSTKLQTRESTQTDFNEMKFEMESFQFNRPCDASVSGKAKAGKRYEYRFDCQQMVLKKTI